jgi:holo-[acyl-carrier protein] synthase
MIAGTGVDLVETARIAQNIEHYGDRFVRRLYTPGEIAYCEKFRKRGERSAARFAVKEAAFKALGSGWREGVRWLDVEVVNPANGKP